MPAAVVHNDWHKTWHNNTDPCFNLCEALNWISYRTHWGMGHLRDDDLRSMFLSSLVGVCKEMLCIRSRLQRHEYFGFFACISPVCYLTRGVGILGDGDQKPNSSTYNFVEVSGHNFERSQTWGCRIQCLHYKPVLTHFCWGKGGGR
jgi:hypothetical protein